MKKAFFLGIILCFIVFLVLGCLGRNNSDSSNPTPTPTPTPTSTPTQVWSMDDVTGVSPDGGEALTLTEDTSISGAEGTGCIKVVPNTAYNEVKVHMPVLTSGQAGIWTSKNYLTIHIHIPADFSGPVINQFGLMVGVLNGSSWPSIFPGEGDNLNLTTGWHTITIPLFPANPFATLSTGDHVIFIFKNNDSSKLISGTFYIDNVGLN